ncbi:hypothetical protein Daus18300_000905 [Diaporthe australafricana]|uniref:Uncharacterized protein n=1 Tax=Diaporthe australafricana TaxID=127596 RepID=A0ABR3Y0N1_9PEZI
MVANFKNEQSQRRLLTAVIAAHPELKLNFKAIAKHFGPEDWGECGIEHFFRPLKKDALVVRDKVKRGEAAKDFYDNKADSTPDGIQWQFRQIKRDAEAMRQGKGGAAAAASSTPVTPKSARKRVASSAPSTGKSTAGKKARVNTPKAVQAPIILDDDDDENEFPPIPLDTPVRGPRFTHKYAEQFLDTQTPHLDLTQPDTPNDDEDFKPLTPSDVFTHSFLQNPQLSSGGPGVPSYATDQPSFTGGTGDSKVWAEDGFDDEV